MQHMHAYMRTKTQVKHPDIDTLACLHTLNDLHKTTHKDTHIQQKNARTLTKSQTYTRCKIKKNAVNFFIQTTKRPIITNFNEKYFTFVFK